MDPITGSFVFFGALAILLGVVVWMAVRRRRDR
jgi:LPXTG-motif cell wall-anchored protein